MKPNQRIVVISGASSGIGLSATKRLSQMGNIVFAGARKEDDIAHLTAIPNVYGVRLDITAVEEIYALARHIESEFGYIDVLINNAGIPGWGAIMDREIEYFRDVMEVNLFGHIQMVQAFYPLLKQSSSSPIIINLSSQAGNYALPFWAPYHMSKWALEAFSDCLRRELLPFGIRVAVIQPGAISSAAFNKQQKDFAQYKAEVNSEFHHRAVAFLQMAFERPTEKERDPQEVVNALIHAIYKRDSKLYYQPGMRLIPDILAARLPQKWVDGLLARIGTPGVSSKPVGDKRILD